MVDLQQPMAVGPQPVPSTTGLAWRQQVVSLVLADPAFEVEVRSSVAHAGFCVASSDGVELAAVVLVDVAGEIERIRSRARTDAAIVFVIRTSDPAAVAQAHAAGAFACIRFPFVGPELAGLIASALDATAAKVRVADLTRELDLQTHLASIGRMSAGLSHELGNPLTAAVMGLGYIRLEVARLAESERLLRDLTSTPVGEMEAAVHAARSHLAGGSGATALFDSMEDIEVAYQRMSAILSSLRALVGQGTVQSEAVDLQQLVRDVRRWAAEALHDVNVVEEQGAPVVVRADAALLGQVVLNLITNAAHAAKTLSSPRVRLHVYTAGTNAVISVRDNGPGIPDAMQDKIFEPFFTTRRGRGGTGLGLSLCREYARQIGAELSFWSVVGRGACFRVTLPMKRS